MNQQKKGEDDADLGPIQTVFSLNLKEGLLSYQTHFDEMLREKKDIKQKIKGKFNAELLSAQGQSEQHIIQ